MMSDTDNASLKNPEKPTGRCCCSQLRIGENVIFMVKENGRNHLFDGNVISVDPKSKKVTVIYLNGYKSITDNIPYERMVARYEPAGRKYRFGGWITGPSVLLDAR